MRPFKTPPKFENHFARMIVRFQAQLEVDGFFFLLKKVPSWHSITNRTSCPVRSFYQGFPCVFLHTAESGVFSKFFVDTLRFLW